MIALVAARPSPRLASFLWPCCLLAFRGSIALLSATARVVDSFVGRNASELLGIEAACTRDVLLGRHVWLGHDSGQRVSQRGCSSYGALPWRLGPMPRSRRCARSSMQTLALPAYYTLLILAPPVATSCTAAYRWIGHALCCSPCACTRRVDLGPLPHQKHPCLAQANRAFSNYSAMLATFGSSPDLRRSIFAGM